jgi:hypothetical protein
MVSSPGARPAVLVDDRERTPFGAYFGTYLPDEQASERIGQERQSGLVTDPKIIPTGTIDFSGNFVG